MSINTITRWDGIPLIPLIWKLSSDSERDIVALTPRTAAVNRFLELGMEFSVIGATIPWIAPRYVEADGTLINFSELDGADTSYINVSIQQITMATNHIEPEIYAAYYDALPDSLKERMP